MFNIKFYTENQFRGMKSDTSIERMSLEEYAQIKNFDALITLGREFLTRGDKDGYFDAFWCFELAVRLRPKSFEAHLGEYKAWFWYCISISKDPFSSMLDDLYNSLSSCTPKKYQRDIWEMYTDDDTATPFLLGEIE